MNVFILFIYAGEWDVISTTASHPHNIRSIAASHTKQPNNYNSHIISSTDKVSQQKNPVLNVSPSTSIFSFPFSDCSFLLRPFQNNRIVKLYIRYQSLFIRERIHPPTHSFIHSLIHPVNHPIFTHILNALSTNPLYSIATQVSFTATPDTHVKT